MLARFDEAPRMRCLAAAVVMLETPVLGIPVMRALVGSGAAQKA